MSFTNMLNKLHGQPDSYDKKSVPQDLTPPSPDPAHSRGRTPPPTPAIPLTKARAAYRFGKLLGAGTFGMVREADVNGKKVAVKIILKKNVKDNEQMVYDELAFLQKINHPHIVRFEDWFESKDKYYIVTQLATGGELFDRICEQGRFTEKDASQTIKQVLEAVDYLHDRNIVHRDLKPENLLYLTKDPGSQLVLADFGIARMLETPGEVLTTMAGSFGYAAPEVMMKQGHGKAVDLWSLGVITYTLLCGYSPFRSENLSDLIDECKTGRITFHERYWRDVSKDAKSFILSLLTVDPRKRVNSKEALKHTWLRGETATDHDLLPEIRSYIAKARLKRGIELVKLANRIEALKMQEDDEDVPGAADVPANARQAAGLTIANQQRGVSPGRGLAVNDKPEKRSLSKIAKGAIFREIVLAKVREMKEKEAQDKLTTVASTGGQKKSAGRG